MTGKGWQLDCYNMDTHEKKWSKSG